MIVEERPTVAHIRAVFGEWYDEVWLNGRKLKPDSSLLLFNHSPDGFSWGYEGSGPAQLALAILLEVTGDPEMALRYHQKFKSSVIARQPQQMDWELDIDVWDWLNYRGAGLEWCAACKRKHFGRCVESLG